MEEEVGMKGEKSGFERLTTWRALPDSRYTLTVDASENIPEKKLGVGIVVQVRNDKKKRYGPVVARYSELYTDWPHGSGEKFAVLRALRLAKEMQARFVKIRSDYNSMRRKLKEAYAAFQIPEDNGLEQEILTLAESFEVVKFCYVPKRKNGVAHSLARQAIRNSRSGAVGGGEPAASGADCDNQF